MVTKLALKKLPKNINKVFGEYKGEKTYGLNNFNLYEKISLNKSLIIHSILGNVNILEFNNGADIKCIESRNILSKKVISWIKLKQLEILNNNCLEQI